MKVMVDSGKQRTATCDAHAIMIHHDQDHKLHCDIPAIEPL